uniref:Putative secreted protein n=1 Tax=Anopheles triannulatus TaxID=58253 RepID=A0A2M4B0U6_9DIPT
MLRLVLLLWFWAFFFSPIWSDPPTVERTVPRHTGHETRAIGSSTGASGTIWIRCRSVRSWVGSVMGFWMRVGLRWGLILSRRCPIRWWRMWLVWCGVPLRG